MQTNLSTAENDRDHALWLCCLRTLVDEDGSELHLGQSRVSGSHTRTADHVRSLDKQMTRCDITEKERYTIIWFLFHEDVIELRMSRVPSYATDVLNAKTKITGGH